MLEKSSINFKLRTFTKNDYEGIVALRNSLYPDHPKTVEMVRHHDKSHKRKIKQKRFVVKKGAAIIVCVGYEQFLDAFHPRKFVIYIHVHNDFRNKGYGSDSYKFILEKLKQFDPIKITSLVNEVHTHAIRFLEDRGFVITMKEQESQLDITAYRPEKYQSEIDRVLNQGLRIIPLSEFRKENKRADYKCWKFECEVSPDMPWTDPITVPEYDHYKKYVLTHPRFNPRSWFIVLDGNTVVGLNNLWKTSIKTIINTGLTGVLKKYRRKGIATALKHTNITWARKQGYESMRTTNVDSNEGMLSINVKIGFKFMPAWLVMEKIIKDEK